MSLADPTKQERIHEFLRKSLLGQELVNTQFHLFSARSAQPHRLTKPRVLCANNILLYNSSKYFLDLLSTDTNPADPSLNDLANVHDVPSNVSVDDYGYASDSDLEDDDEEPPTFAADSEPKKRKDRSAVRPTNHLRINIAPQPDDNELSEDGSDSDSSDIFVMSPEHPTLDELAFLDGAGSLSSVMTTVQEQPGGDNQKVNLHETAAHLRILGSRHILVKDTAFQTWYALLNYLYTDQFSFLPLTSRVPRGQPRESPTSSVDELRCSAKSMYRLACKVGLDSLRDEALAHIRSNLSEHNIIKELSCSLVSRHPELLEMELDVFYSLFASPSVVTGFPVLAQRIANKELPHGAEIIVGIHTRLLRAPLSWSNEPGAPPESPSSDSAGTFKFPSAFPRPSSPLGVATPLPGPRSLSQLSSVFSQPQPPPKPQATSLFSGFTSWGSAASPPQEPSPVTRAIVSQSCDISMPVYASVCEEACPLPAESPTEEIEIEPLSIKKGKKGGAYPKGKKKTKSPCEPA